MLPPRHLKSTLDGAVKLRNKLAHVGRELDGSSPELKPSVKEVLTMASDLLWLFDVYRGHQWALEHLSKQTRAALNLADVEFE